MHSSYWGHAIWDICISTYIASWRRAPSLHALPLNYGALQLCHQQDVWCSIRSSAFGWCICNLTRVPDSYDLTLTLPFFCEVDSLAHRDTKWDSMLVSKILHKPLENSIWYYVDRQVKTVPRIGTYIHEEKLLFLSKVKGLIHSSATKWVVGS